MRPVAVARHMYVCSVPLAEKPSKRDVARSREHLLAAESQYQMNTAGAFFYPERHLKIDNTDLLPDAVARQIIEHFGIPITP